MQWDQVTSIVDLSSGLSLADNWETGASFTDVWEFGSVIYFVGVGDHGVTFPADVGVIRVGAKSFLAGVGDL